MRYEFDDTNFVEFESRWTRKDIRTISTGTGEEYVDTLRRKIVAVHLDLSDGAITSPEELTDEAIDNMDWVLWRWFSATPMAVIKDLSDLGEAQRRRLLGIAEETD